jgi:hypothetical protein
VLRRGVGGESRVRVRRLIVLAPQQPVFPLVLVFDVLDAQEAEAAGDGHGEHDHEQAAAGVLRGPHRGGHREAADEEDDRVDGAQRLLR